MLLLIHCGHINWWYKDPSPKAIYDCRNWLTYDGRPQKNLPGVYVLMNLFISINSLAYNPISELFFHLSNVFLYIFWFGNPIVVLFPQYYGGDGDSM